MEIVFPRMSGQYSKTVADLFLGTARYFLGSACLFSVCPRTFWSKFRWHRVYITWAFLGLGPAGAWFLRSLGAGL